MSKKNYMTDNLVPVKILLDPQERLMENFNVTDIANGIRSVVSALSGMGPIPNLSISGTSSQISSFVELIAREKNLYDAYVRHGLSDPRTHQNQVHLQYAAAQFERETGIKYPFST